MSAIIYLHGNPGTPDDFALVRREAATAGDRTIAPARTVRPGDRIDDLVRDLDRIIGDAVVSAGSATVVAYSWGAYLALQHAVRGGRRPERIVLVNPYLVVENPLGALAPIVLGLPGLGSALLARSAGKWAREMVARSFAPGAPSDDQRRSLEHALGDARLWRSAVHAKRLQQTEPLPVLDSLPCPVSLLRGASDAVAHWDRQSAPLARVVASIDCQVIDGAGHALPWTHPAAVARAIAAQRRAA